MNRRQILATTAAGIVGALPFAKGRLAAAETAAVSAKGVDWKLAGNYFEACSCEVVCPCIFQSAPSHGDCAVLYAWRIDRGNYQATALDGLNVALAAYADGHMAKVKWLAAVYIDDRATSEQNAALKRIFTGTAGGFPAGLAGFFERFIGVKSAPIHYVLDGKKRAVEIPGVMSASIHAIAGQEGGDAVIAGHPLGLAPGNPLIVAQSDSVTLTDYEWNWKFSGRSGGYSPFQYQGA
jgi:hypothetical protein